MIESIDVPIDIMHLLHNNPHQAKPVVSWSQPAKAKVPLKSVSTG